MQRITTNHISFYSNLIETLGYDPLYALLEIKLATDGRIRQYKNVPEYIWYRLRSDYHPDVFYRRNICGHYVEVILPEEESSGESDETIPDKARIENSA